MFHFGTIISEFSPIFFFFFFQLQERLQSKRFTKTATNSQPWCARWQRLMSVAWVSKFYRLQSKMFTMTFNIWHHWAKHKRPALNVMPIRASLKPIGNIYDVDKSINSVEWHLIEPLNDFHFLNFNYSDAGIREAECEKSAMDVKYSTDTKIEDNSRMYKLQKAHFDQEINTAVSKSKRTKHFEVKLIFADCCHFSMHNRKPNRS